MTNNLRSIAISLTIGLIAFLIFPTCQRQSINTVFSQGNTYYVATNGNDSNNGSESTPWRTIQKAANTLTPGDTVFVRAGVYTEAVTVNVSGSAVGGYITIKNYPNETPILDGSALTVPNVDNGLFLMVDQNYVIIEGFELRNYATATQERVPVGVNIRGTAHHIQVKNNRIHDIETNATPTGPDLLGADAHGIAVYGTESSQSINHILIEGNELYDLKLGSSEGVVLNGNVEVFTVTNNLIRDSDNIALDFIGFEGTASDATVDQARNGLVQNNTIYNIDTLNNPSYGGERSAGGIYVDGGTNIIIEGNQVYSSNIGIEIASEHQGRATSFITVRNNILHHNHLSGLVMGGYDANRGSTENCVVVNNTLYNNDTQEDGNGEILLQFDTQNNIIKNNILYPTNSQSLLIGNVYTQNTGNVVDYNLYFSPAGADSSEWQWKNVTYQGFTAYKTGSGNDSHALFVDPQLVDPSSFDFHLGPQSPAIAKGDDTVSAGATDFEGDPRFTNGAIDIGADQSKSNIVFTDFVYLPIILRQ